MDRLDSIEEKLRRIDQKLTSLLLEKNKKRETWVTAIQLRRITGWSYAELRAMKRSGLVEYKLSHTSRHSFLLESISPELLKKA